MAWFKRKKGVSKAPRDTRTQVPEGLWVRCEECREIVYSRDLDQNGHVCPKCSHHFRIDADQRIDQLLDEGGRKELFRDVLPADPLHFVDSRSCTRSASRPTSRASASTRR